MKRKRKLPGRAGAPGSKTCMSRWKPCRRGSHSLRRLSPSSLNEFAAREYRARRGATRAPKPTPHTCATYAAAARPSKIYGVPLLWFSGFLQCRICERSTCVPRVCPKIICERRARVHHNHMSQLRM
eukprot:2781705-Prymnesium_polylepis.1